MNLELFIQLQERFLQFLLDDELPIPLLNPKEGFQNIQDRQIKHIASILQALALKVGIFAFGQYIF